MPGPPLPPQVPWWLGRGVGLALLTMVAGIGWAFSWGIAAESAVPPAPTSSGFEQLDATTDLVSSASTPSVSAAPAASAAPTSPDEAIPEAPADDGRDLVGTDSPPRSTPAPRLLPAEVLRKRQQALIRRAERRDRELAAFIEAAGLVEQLWVTPISSLYRITATFGAAGSLWSADHTGVDLAAPSGTPVASVAAGTVTSAEDAGAYGLRVAVAHADGTETWYAHLSRIDVSVGQPVEQGQVIGAVGTTGNSTGPHLHLELRPQGGVAVDPLVALRARGVELDLAP